MASVHLPVTELGVDLDRPGGHKQCMRRLWLVFMALVLAVVTTAVPANRAAKMSGQLGSAPWQELAAQDVSGARTTTVTFKRCQSGAGMLSCPFYRPVAPVNVAPREISSIIGTPGVQSPFAGRSVPPPSRPPKSISA